MPVTCPIGRPDAGIHGHSGTPGHHDDLHRHCSGGAQSQPSKLVILLPMAPGLDLASPPPGRYRLA